MQALVTILTPVYNGGAYLRECIESVLAQDYENWQYIIVDNCSTDDTAHIAQSYARRDGRIRHSRNKAFLSMPQNFNNAFSMVSAASRYCKIVCADDWLFPRCLGRMLAFAQAHPSVGIVACYQQSGRHVRWAELPPTTTVLTGREACRLVLMEGAQIFPAPTAALYRSDLVLGEKPFFPNDRPHSDTSACFEHLANCDFGILHEVLAEERVHDGQITSQIAGVDAGNAAYVELLLEYGPRYLQDDELTTRRASVLEEYYLSLGRGLLRLRGREYWSFHRRRLAEIGLPMQRWRIAASAIKVAAAHFKAPAATLPKRGTGFQHRARR
jgi:glycosyltransferase involved in cell wall biosynthesis